MGDDGLSQHRRHAEAHHETVPRILCIATDGGIYARRIRALMSDYPAHITFHDFDRSLTRYKNYRTLRRLLKSQEWDLVIQVGPSVAAGLNLIRARLEWDQPFIASFGDPIGGWFRVIRGPFWAVLGNLYERALYRSCSGFAGCSPYLVGTAIKWGARRATTIVDAVNTDVFRPVDARQKRELKARYGLNPDHIVCGFVGDLPCARRDYSRGIELIGMLQYLNRRDVAVFIVGDGDGLQVLKDATPKELRDRIVFPGWIPHEEVVSAINAMDVGFLTQPMDALGMYRLTTKLPEYLSCGVPVAMTPVPAYYDYLGAAGWSLPESHPESSAFHRECAEWLDQLSPDELESRSREARRLAERVFSYHVVTPQFWHFVDETLRLQSSNHKGVSPTAMTSTP